jgi:hypothetical protein
LIKPGEGLQAAVRGALDTIKAAGMNEVYCVFVIMAALIGLTLPTSGAVFYVPFAVELSRVVRRHSPRGCSASCQKL